MTQVVDLDSPMGPRLAGEAPPDTVAPGRAEGQRWPLIGWVGVGLVGTFTVVALATPWITPYDPNRLGGGSYRAPSRDHLLGTNQIGQDLLSQLLAGARTSVFIAVVAGVLTVMLGAVVGLLAGWFGGGLDLVLKRVVDVSMAIPRLPLLIILGSFVGSGSLSVAMVIAFVFWAGTARVVRARVQPLRRSAQVKAAAGFGAGPLHLWRRHVFPEISLILVASLVSAAGRAVLFEAGLALLGIGQSSRLSWGATINTARQASGLFYTNIWTWWIVPPVVCLVLFLLGISFIGVAVEQRVNPRVSRHASGSRP